MTLQLGGLSPYWMDRATCTLNPVQLRGLYLLTAPNMSGKSTLMRSVLVAALLANCGLCVPCSSATVPRYAMKLMLLSRQPFVQMCCLLASRL